MLGCLSLLWCFDYCAVCREWELLRVQRCNSMACMQGLTALLCAPHSTFCPFYVPM
jgi:hypothetical protein